LSYTPRFKNRRPKRSLRTILVLWFLLLALVPAIFVTGYSLVKYEQAINSELVQRLRANVREVATTIGDVEKIFVSRRLRHRNDQVLLTYLSTNSVDQARQHILGVSRNTLLSKVNLFNRSGDIISSLDRNDILGTPTKTAKALDYSLSEAFRKALESKVFLSLVEFAGANTMDLISITKIESKSGKPAGYIEEIFTLGPSFLENLKNRLNLEILLLDAKGIIVAGSHPDFQVYPKNFFVQTIGSDSETLFDLTVRNEPFGFVISKVPWAESAFLIGLGASKQKSKAVLKNVNYAFLTVIVAVGLLAVIFSFFTARIILRPLNELLDGIQTTDRKEGPVEIPITTDNEIGVVTESFNEMSQRVWQSKQELEKKVKETEAAYSELKETQARLVHTAKMASLGQLVAGVAHELNNPIGFIYSNMTHLRDYTNRLKKIIETAEAKPKDLAKIKEELEYDYIIGDLQKLIQSCEEGASRTRDIVLGLRNFSRLEEAKLKKVQLEEGIENTLQMISGELKNRVVVHTDYAKMPEVMCYASELNQVFMNLLTNAAQAIENEGEIWIQVRSQGEKAIISIRDSGRGMTQATAEKIFDPFFTTKAIGKGTGLGLSISYGIVKKHGGDITVQSEPGKGTEFKVSVPIDGPPTSQNSNPS
jgi:two-component system, NtrC family, sensor kinase